MTQIIDKIMKIAIFEKKYHEIQTGYEKNPDD